MENNKSEFKPTISEINRIGDELKFQREYYNSTHTMKLELDDRNAIGNYELLGVKLAEYLFKNKIIEKEKIDGISPEVLKIIENSNYTIYTGKKDKKTVYDPSTHYFEIFYMFKIYGYLDDFDIFKLLEKYNVLSEVEKMKQEKNILSEKKEILLQQIEEYKQNCRLENRIDNKNIFINLKNPIVVSDITDIRFLLDKTDKDIVFFSNKQRLESLILEPRHTNNQIYFSKIYKFIIDNFKNMSSLQRKCKSLEIGQETGFVDDVINDKITEITLNTMRKILECLDLQNSDIYFFINKRIEMETHTNKKYEIIIKNFESI